MNREQQIQRAAQALAEVPEELRSGNYSDAILVLDAILPQVTTVAELEALPIWSVVLFPDGAPYRKASSDRWWSSTGAVLLAYDLAAPANYEGPLTVVWTPEVKA